MLRTIVLSTVIGVAVALACLLVAMLLGSINLALATAVAAFLGTYATALGVLAALWYGFTHV